VSWGRRAGQPTSHAAPRSMVVLRSSPSRMWRRRAWPTLRSHWNHGCDPWRLPGRARTQDIDAAIIGSPDPLACSDDRFRSAAGKDVYVEKPAEHSWRRGKSLLTRCARAGRVVAGGIPASAAIRTSGGVRTGPLGQDRARDSGAHLVESELRPTVQPQWGFGLWTGKVSWAVPVPGNSTPGATVTGGGSGTTAAAR